MFLDQLDRMPCTLARYSNLRSTRMRGVQNLGEQICRSRKTRTGKKRFNMGRGKGFCQKRRKLCIVAALRIYDSIQSQVPMAHPWKHFPTFLVEDRARSSVYQEKAGKRKRKRQRHSEEATTSYQTRVCSRGM